jgi:pimeloyl-ACP methyl ester carboxylesterase
LTPISSVPPASGSASPPLSTASFAVAQDGTRLFVRKRTGASDITAVLTDGIGCDGFIWKYLWDDLAALVSVAHWNYRGHGRSGLPADRANIEIAHHASDLDTVRWAVGDPEVVLIGHSMGCQVSLEAYRLRPEKVRALVLICGASGRITHTFKGTSVLAQLVPPFIERVDAHPEVVRAIWGRVNPEVAMRFAMLTGEVDARAVRPEDLRSYMKHMIDIDVSMFLHTLKAAGEHSAADLLPLIKVPVLVIAGDRDTFTPPRYAEEMAAAIPGAELLTVSGGTHIAPIERRELVREHIERFLRERVQV